MKPKDIIVKYLTATPLKHCIKSFILP